MKQLSQTIFKTFSFGLVTLFFFATGCQQPDVSKELKPIADAYLEAWNTGNLDPLDAIIDPQFVRHVSPASTMGAVGLDSLKKVISNFRTTYPDFHLTIDESIFISDKSAGRWRYTATNTGLGNIPPTGKKITATGMSILHYKNGKIIEEWVETDNLVPMQQLGFTLTPPPVVTEK